MEQKHWKTVTATEFIAGSDEKTVWYQVEQNTCALLKAVVSHRRPAKMSGDDFWNLMRLTWINAHLRQPVEGHWRRLKIPALADLFDAKRPSSDTLESAVIAMHLPSAVAEAAMPVTGMINFYTTYRYTCQLWCRQNRDNLRDVVQRAMKLGANDQARLDLAADIAALPRIPSPSGTRKMDAAGAVTPLIACLDSRGRFPIVNGHVRKLLQRLQLDHDNLESQVRGFINLVGQFGISDAQMIDVLAEELSDRSWNLVARDTHSEATGNEEGSELQSLDELERMATIKSKTMKYRARHRRMTNAIKQLFSQFVLKQGNKPDCMYDILIKSYDGKKRDLLIEAKPDPDHGAIRIAIGQLFDYRRHLPNRAGTDLVFLTITKPEPAYIELLMDLQVSVLWFTGEECASVDGAGKAWCPIEITIRNSQ